MEDEKTAVGLAARAVFARNVRRARRSTEMSQEELAHRAELSRVFVGEVERGRRSITIDNMAQLAHGLGIPLRDLVDPEMFKVAGEE